MDLSKLISNTDFGILIEFQNYSNIEYRNIRNRYDAFLKQPLKLEMFVPCDEEGKVLKEPFTDLHVMSDVTRRESQAYKLAKSKVLFEGFETQEIFTPSESFQLVNEEIGIQVCVYKALPNYFIWNYKTTEDLANKCITITETALKQIYS